MNRDQTKQRVTDTALDAIAELYERTEEPKLLSVAICLVAEDGEIEDRIRTTLTVWPAE